MLDKQTPFEMPLVNLDNPAEVEALFGNFGLADHFRKVILATCAELIRAGAAVTEPPVKITESRVDDLAHTHEKYIDFLLLCLNGRRQREQNVMDTISQGGQFR